MAYTTTPADNETIANLPGDIRAVKTLVTAHTGATSAAHDASAITYGTGTVDDALDTAASHEANTSNPHNVTAAQAEALPASGGTVTGTVTMSGAKIIGAVGSAIASASTVNLSTATGQLVHITGTTAITSITMTAGQWCLVEFDGILTLTHNAATNNLPGAANITTAAGDRALYYYDGTAVKCIYQRADGSAIVGGGGSLRGLKIQVTSNTAATITTDEVLLHDSSNNPKSVFGISLTLATGTTGAGGLDTGSLAASTWYYVYVIYGTSGTACLMSASATAPTLPSGYTYYARVGAVRTNSSSYLMRTMQYGRRAQYIVDGTILTGIRCMLSGSSGSVDTPTWTAIAVSSFIPATAGIIHLSILDRSESGKIIVAPNSNYGHYENVSNPPPLMADTCGSQSVTITGSIVLESSYIYCASSSSNQGLFCTGWEDNL